MSNQDRLIAPPDDCHFCKASSREQLLPVGDAGAGAKLAAVLVIPCSLVQAIYCRAQGAGVLLQEEEAILRDVVVEVAKGCGEVGSCA